MTHFRKKNDYARPYPHFKETEEIGVIEKAEFVRYDGRIGLCLTLACDNGHVQTGTMLVENRNPAALDLGFLDLIDEMQNLMIEAKVNELSKLAGTPVLMVFRGNLLERFRVLSEAILRQAS